MFVTLLLAASLEVTSLPAPEYADCEVLTNCVFDVSQNAGGLFSLRIELDASPSNCVEVVFGHDTDGDGTAGSGRSWIAQTARRRSARERRGASGSTGGCTWAATGTPGRFPRL